DGIRYFHVTGVQTCALPIYFIPFLRMFYLAYTRRTTGIFEVKRSKPPILFPLLRITYLTTTEFACCDKFCTNSANNQKASRLCRSEERRVGKECRERLYPCQ